MQLLELKRLGLGRSKNLNTIMPHGSGEGSDPDAKCTVCVCGWEHRIDADSGGRPWCEVQSINDIVTTTCKFRVFNPHDA